MAELRAPNIGVNDVGFNKVTIAAEENELLPEL